MAWEPDQLLPFGRLADAGSGLLFLLLGLAVLFVRPLRRVQVAFALFATSFGLAYLLGNVPGRETLQQRVVIYYALHPLAIAGLVALATWFPSPLAPRARRWVLQGIALGIGLLAAATLITAFGSGGEALQGHDLPFRVGYTSLFAVGFGTLFYVLARRFAALDGTAESTRQKTLAGLATVSFLPWFGLATGIYGAMRAGSSSDRFFAFPPLVLVPLLLILVALWLGNTARGTTQDRATARRIAVLGAGFAALGAVFATVIGISNQPNNLGLLGLARAFGVAVLAYAILKHQLLGLDVKVRFAIKGSTLAAVFIGVFFVASELAQQFFGDRTQNEYIGIAAAGGLVFAMAPLQRMADRVAAKAVPATSDPSESDAAGNEQAYGLLLQRVLRDGVVSRDEERALARVATRLGITAERALALREAAEAPPAKVRRR